MSAGVDVGGTSSEESGAATTASSSSQVMSSMSCSVSSDADAATAEQELAISDLAASCSTAFVLPQYVTSEPDVRAASSAAAVVPGQGA